MWAVSISELGAFSSMLVLTIPLRNCCFSGDGLFLEPFTKWSRIPDSVNINYVLKHKEADFE